MNDQKKATSDHPIPEFSENQMTTIAQAILELATDKIVRSELPDIDLYTRGFLAEIKRGDSSAVEDTLVNLYIHLHTAGATYSPLERKLLNMRSGYSCYPGGLFPLIKAEPFIGTESVVVDLGAGNGLQGLLLQYLYPHRKTLQIELSSEMIRIGRIFQQALGILDDSVEWIKDDIVNVSIEAADFIYIYRPARSCGSGRKIYQAIARKLTDVDKPLVVFSIADCLGKFLEGFSIFYTDGHLTCFIKG